MRRIQSKPLHHSFRHTHRLSLLLIVCVSFLFVEVAHACSCRFEEEKGFIHGSGRLPSNARGVLFRVSHLEGMISYQPGFSIVNILPSQFDANSFVIREAGKDTPLPAVIEKVTPTNSEGSARRIYFTDDRDLQVCLQTMDHGSCQATQVKLDKEDWRQTLISSGRLRDVTDLASGSGELFRVRPAKGFVEGLTYEIEHKAHRKVEPIKASERSFFIGEDRSNKITIEIGAPLNISDKDQFAINRLGALKRESISLSASGSCSESRSGTSQMLRYELPAQYEAYRTSMVYFTETKIPNVND